MNTNRIEVDKNTNLLDGKALYYSFLAGAQRIFENQQLLNKMNVFPVADADTGTNFASTMRSIVETIEPSHSVRDTAASIANAALIGARGNSGIIFAQFLYGFSNEITSDKDITVDGFAHILKNSVKYAYQAITNPVEGTMITVIREWAEYIYLKKDTITSFDDLFVLSLEKAKESLEQTKTQLQVLAKANVVDAGAKAFVLFLEGIIEFFKQGIKMLLGSRRAIKIEELGAITHEEITFRYCTEALITGEKLNHDRIREDIALLGDSVVVAGSPQKTRIHIHTDNPSVAFYRLAKHGLIAYQKVDDMIFQNDVATMEKPSMAILTDSTCDIPRDLLDKYKIHVVPLNVHFGDHYFLDGISISGKQFSKLFHSSALYPTTSQPSFKDFTNKYAYLFTQYDSVVAMHITGAMSGTWANSSKAAEFICAETGKKADVIDTKRITGGLGLMVLRAAQMAEAGKSHQEIVEAVNTWKTKARVFVTTTTVKYMVKSGRLSPMKGLIGKLLGVKPVVFVNDEGKGDTLAKAFTEMGSARIVIKQIQKILETEKMWNFAITHFNNSKVANWYATEIKKLTGLEPIFITELTPVLAIHGGPGLVTINILTQ